MAEPDESRSGRPRTPWSSSRLLALPWSGAGGTTIGGTLALLRRRLEKALAPTWSARRSIVQPIPVPPPLGATAAVAFQGGMMLDDAGTWARLVATRLPASCEMPAMLTCTLTLYGPDGEEVMSTSATSSSATPSSVTA